MRNNSEELSFEVAAFVGVIILICLFCWGSAGEATTSKPIRLGEWKSPPSIEICDSSPASLSRVISAVEWWNNLGYSFGEVYKQERNGACFTGNVGGHITINNFSQPTSSSATTLVHVNDDKEIKWAKIKLSLDKNRVLEHEIGHALGWAHVDISGHIMNSKLELGGWKNCGLKLE